MILEIYEFIAFTDLLLSRRQQNIYCDNNVLAEIKTKTIDSI